MRNRGTQTGGVDRPFKRVLLMIGTEYANARPVLGGIADYVDHHPGWQLRLEIALQPALIERGDVDGMIVEPRDWPIQDALRRSSIPAITVVGVPAEKGPPSVVVDNRAVGRMAADHLADLGLKHLAFVPTPGAQHSRHRAEGFATRCAARHISVTMCDPTIANDDSAVSTWIGGLPTPVGIFAANDRKALMVARACRLANRRIAEQVALLGVDNEVETCRLTNPPLSSIDQGARRIGYEAARLLDSWMTTGRRPPNSVLIQPIGVVSRPSTDLLAVSDPDVVAAIRFIRTEATRPLHVGDVAKHVALSRRSLELRFQRTIGRTIHAEIMRARIDQARNLLITSDWDMPHIADVCGFAFASQFSRDFKRETGMPPVRFRHQYRYRPGSPA